MKKIRNLSVMSAIAVCFLTTPLHAANWLQLQGTEAPNAGAANFFGFIQAQYQANEIRPVTGLQDTTVTAATLAASQYNNHDPVFNLVGPDSSSSTQFQIFRARPGVRGVIPNTNNKINYFFLVDVGNNGATRASRPVITDASLTFNYITGARIRVGAFKAPTGEEALIPVNNMDFVNFSTVTDNLLNERFVQKYTTTRITNNPTAPTTQVSELDGNFSGFRDVGIQVFDWFNLKNGWELGYAAMLGQGNGTNWSDRDNNLDKTFRLQTSYILNPASKGMKREDVTLYAWKQDGARDFGGRNYDRSRDGFGVTYRQGKLHAGAEYIHGKGMIYNGPNLPFNDIGGTAAEPVQLIDLAGEANGYAVNAGYNIFTNTWFNLRYDVYHRSTARADLQRNFNTLTAGVQYQFTPKLRLDANYEFRNMEVAHPESFAKTGNGPVILNNAQRIAESIADRWSLQLTWHY